MILHASSEVCLNRARHWVVYLVRSSLVFPQDRLAGRLEKREVSADRLVVATKHTHNAPTLVGYAPIVWKGRTTLEQDQRVEAYTRFVIDKMEQAVVQALAKRESMTLEWTQGRATFGGHSGGART